MPRAWEINDEPAQPHCSLKWPLAASEVSVAAVRDHVKQVAMPEGKHRGFIQVESLPNYVAICLASALYEARSEERPTSTACLTLNVILSL